jgi:DNA-binding beta-propeller fold protein YncE
VPTSVAVGPGGALYVSLLRGVPSDRGAADIYRVVPGRQPEIWASGLTSATPIAFDHQGRLLATQYNTSGLLSPPTVACALVRISDNGHTVTTLPVTDLYQPTGLAVSADGKVYVSSYGDSNTTSAQAGEIVTPGCPDLRPRIGHASRGARARHAACRAGRLASRPGQRPVKPGTEMHGRGDA